MTAKTFLDENQALGRVWALEEVKPGVGSLMRLFIALFPRSCDLDF
jgi:hypothetical protein